MIEGKTKSGFKFKVNENIFKDWDFVTLADSVSRGGASMSDVNALLAMVLGDKGFASLKEHIKKREGYINVDAVKAEFDEIVSHTKLKN